MVFIQQVGMDVLLSPFSPQQSLWSCEDSSSCFPFCISPGDGSLANKLPSFRPQGGTEHSRFTHSSTQPRASTIQHVPSGPWLRSIGNFLFLRLTGIRQLLVKRILFTVSRKECSWIKEIWRSLGGWLNYVIMTRRSIFFFISLANSLKSGRAKSYEWFMLAAGAALCMTDLKWIALTRYNSYQICVSLRLMP